jgi:hypothetical protein
VKYALSLLSFLSVSSVFGMGAPIIVGDPSASQGIHYPPGQLGHFEMPIPPSTYHSKAKAIVPTIHNDDCDELIALKIASGWLGLKADHYDWLDRWAPGTKEKQIEFLLHLQRHPDELNKLGDLWNLADAAYKAIKARKEEQQN